jgi:hypothetical protein
MLRRIARLAAVAVMIAATSLTLAVPASSELAQPTGVTMCC